jgi:hypothetical protein
MGKTPGEQRKQIACAACVIQDQFRIVGNGLPDKIGDIPIGALMGAIG